MRYPHIRKFWTCGFAFNLYTRDMLENNSTHGRPSKEVLPLLHKRKQLVKGLLKEKYSKAEIAYIFRVHPAQITRILQAQSKGRSVG